MFLIFLTLKFFEHICYICIIRKCTLLDGIIKYLLLWSVTHEDAKLFTIIYLLCKSIEQLRLIHHIYHFIIISLHSFPYGWSLKLQCHDLPHSSKYCFSCCWWNVNQLNRKLISVWTINILTFNKNVTEKLDITVLATLKRRERETKGAMINGLHWLDEACWWRFWVYRESSLME